MGIKIKKYEGGAGAVSLTGKVVKKAKPQPSAYLPSSKVKQGGGNPLSYSQGAAGDKADRVAKPGMGDYSNSALYGKKSFAKTGVKKFEKGTAGIKMKSKAK